MRETHGGGEAELSQEAEMGLQELRQRCDAEAEEVLMQTELIRFSGREEQPPSGRFVGRKAIPSTTVEIGA
jgi:hypothetical protein